MAASNPWSNEKIGVARELYDAGMSARACATALSDRFGESITRNAVIGIWFRQNLGGRAKPAPAKRIEPRKRPSRVVRLIRPTAGGHLHIIESTEVVDQSSLRVAESESLHTVALLDLEHHHCRYAFGKNPPFQFCAQPVDGESSWCKAHRALCFQPAKERRRA